MMVHLSTILAFITAVISCVQGQLTIDYEGTLFVIASSPLNISCHGSNTNEVTWTKAGQDVNTFGFDVSKKMDTIDGKLQAKTTISKSKTNISDSGEYKCKGKDHQGEKTLFVRIIEVSTTTTEFNMSMPEATMACNLKMSAGDFTMKWKFLGKELSSSGDKYDIRDNGTLVIKKPKRNDAGEYQCVFTFTDNNQDVVVLTHFYIAPYVKSFDKSKNLIQGDHLTLRCNVIAHPSANVTWYKNKKSVDDMKRVTVMDDEESKVVNGKLRIESVEFEDKGDYMCIAYSSRFNLSANSTIVVRVKDKLAALWPFLGIVAEVIVLCIIIFIYEKKRSKTEEDDDGADTANSANAADHKGDVRQRNVKA